MSVSEAAPNLPASIAFHMEGQLEAPIETLDLEFGTDLVLSCAASEYTSVRMDVEPGRDVEADWEWDMRRTGSVPPGSTVWWRWRAVDAKGREFRSPRQELTNEDARFDWLSHQSENITYYWYAGGDDFGERLADAVGGGLERLELGRETVKPIKAFVYESSSHVRGAILFAQAWTGGLAFGSHNVLLITVDPEEFDEDLGGVVHELAHLLLAEVTFNCFGRLPTWLNEGLAVYSEGDLPDFQRRALDAAVASDELISLRSLNGAFPAGDTGATLSYAQSRSLVDYLISTYGWDQMNALLATLGEGTTYESALEQVYGIDLDGLEQAWRASLGLN